MSAGVVGLKNNELCILKHDSTLGFYLFARMQVQHNKIQLKSFRKKLRNQGTSAEAELWKYLSNKKLGGRKFRRQHSVGYFILDFYCPSEKLAVELDGEHHYWQAGIDKDLRKELYLHEHSIKVLRFENKWVFQDLEYVLKTISSAFHK